MIHTMLSYNKLFGRSCRLILVQLILEMYVEICYSYIKTTHLSFW